MKKILYMAGFALFASLLFTTSCTKDEDANPFQSVTPKGAVASVSNVVNGFFNIADPENASVAFDLATKGEKVTSLLITKSVNGSAESDLKTVTSFPSTVDLTLNEALAGTGIDAASLNPGDQAVLTFYVTTASGTYVGGHYAIDMSCVSNLATVFDLVTTGWCGEEYTGVYEFRPAEEPGQYLIWDLDNDVEDFSLGAYYVCYGATASLPDGDLKIQDICNTISQIGKSQWGETYYIDALTIDGPKMTLVWHNDYAPEAGTAVMTRQDGSDWPPLTF